METNQEKKIKIPYPTVTPYLIAKSADKLIDFLKNAFEATELERHLAPDGTIMHAEVGIGDSMIMISEASDKYPATQTAIYLYMSDCDAYFNRAVQAGATILTEPADQNYGDRTSGIKDLAGNTWWIASPLKKE